MAAKKVGGKKCCVPSEENTKSFVLNVIGIIYEI